MRKILTFSILAVIFITPVIAVDLTKSEIRGAIYGEISSPNNTTLLWKVQNFTGYFYPVGEITETLRIDQTASNLTGSREIHKSKLLYNTSWKSQKYLVFSEKGKKVDNGLEYNDSSGTFTKKSMGGYYARIYWFGGLFVAVNGRANRLARLVKEQEKEEKQIIELGTTWKLGDGYSLEVEALDAKVSPRQAWLSLSRDGKTLNEKIVNEGEVYTYVEKSLKDELDVPVFTTYVDSIFSGNASGKVQLRYTWLISQNVTEIKVGDEFGELKVKEANKDYLLLSNNDKINLEKDKDVNIGGGIKFRVDDNSNVLRFYPFVERTIKALSQEILAANITDAAPTFTTIPANTHTPGITAMPTILQTSGPEPSLTFARTAALADARTSESSGTAVPQDWYLVLGATLGLITTGYLVSRKK